jgi:hypothetical protein
LVKVNSLGLALDEVAIKATLKVLRVVAKQLLWQRKMLLLRTNVNIDSRSRHQSNQIVSQKKKKKKRKREAEEEEGNSNNPKTTGVSTYSTLSCPEGLLGGVLKGMLFESSKATFAGRL